MGEYEKTEKRAYAKFLLRTLMAGSLVLVAGTIASADGRRVLKALRSFTAQELAHLRRAVRNLERRRLIRRVQDGEDTKIRLTVDGHKEAAMLRLHELTISRPTQWDGKWRLVIFDIPEYLKVGRDALRNTLNRLGFYQIQKSVFIFPFPCEKEIGEVASVFSFERYVHCFHVEVLALTYRKRLMQHFKI